MKLKCKYRGWIDNKLEDHSDNNLIKKIYYDVYNLLQNYRKERQFWDYMDISLQTTNELKKQTLIICFHFSSENKFSDFMKNENKFLELLQKKVNFSLYEIYLLSTDEDTTPFNKINKLFPLINPRDAVLVLSFVLAVVIAGFILFLRTSK